MLDTLTYFYQGRATIFDDIVAKYVTDGGLDDDFIENIEGISFGEEELSPREHLNALHGILAIAILAQNHPQSEEYCSALSTMLHGLRRIPLWRECQLLSAIDAFIAILVGEKPRDIVPIQYDKGAAPLETGDHWMWGAIPHHSLHAELGAIWAAIGSLTKDKTLIAAARNIALWHNNTIAHDGTPLQGIYSQEPDGNPRDVMQYDYMLFRTVAIATRDAFMEHRACEIRNAIKVLDGGLEHSRGSYPFLVAAWAETLAPVPQPHKEDLPTAICDETLALAGIRGENFTIISTATGGGTGLGACRFDDVDIITYGPQYLPLGECEGFGIEGGETFSCDITDDGFEVSGRAKLSAYSPDGIHMPTKKWIDIRQEAKNNALTIETSILNLYNAEEIAFVFYIKAKTCHLGTMTLHPHSLERYEGKNIPIAFVSDNGAVKITTENHNPLLQVVPLAGNKDFWGANFLVAYSIQPHFKPYHWKIQHSMIATNEV